MSTPAVAVTGGGAGEGGRNVDAAEGQHNAKGEGDGGKGTRGSPRCAGASAWPAVTRLGRTAEAVGGRVLPNDSPDGRGLVGRGCPSQTVEFGR